MTKIEESIVILKSLGLPKSQQNDRSALTLLALLDVGKQTLWKDAVLRNIRIHDIILFIERQYGKTYAENTRETIRRHTLHQFEQAGIVVRNTDCPDRPTNSPKTVYSISKEALNVIQKYATSQWERALSAFLDDKGKLIDRYQKRKKTHAIQIDLDEGTHLEFTPGKHNTLQVKIIEEFRPRFCPNTVVVYVGDTARKMLHVKKDALIELKIPITKHDKLPDVVLYDKSKNVLVLIEAVTTHGPLSPKRQIELEKTLEHCTARRIYVSAFPDFREFKKHIDNIAWETEVWIENNPDHMVHFNGPKFFTIYNE